MATIARPVPAWRMRHLWARWSALVLRLPLLTKLAGANALIVLVAWTAVYVHQRARTQDESVLIVLAVALAAGMTVNLLLLFAALRPIRMLEATASRVWQGDLAARVPWSPIADTRLERLAVALNVLLETLARDRTRARALAGRVIHLGDQQRAAVARELHESLAQSLAGLLYRISAAERLCVDPECQSHLESARTTAQQCIEDMRQLSGRVHPTILDDFGLMAALRQLARTLETPSTRIHVSEGTRPLIPADAASLLYRVAEEAVQNSIRHAGASRIDIDVDVKPALVTMVVRDDGTGFDSSRIDISQSSTGLGLIGERLAFAGGGCAIESAPGRGTKIAVRLPLAPTTIEQSHSHSRMGGDPDRVSSHAS